MTRSRFAFFLCPFSPYYRSVSFLLGFGVLFWAYSDSVRRQWDFPVYYLASRSLWHSVDPYDVAAFQSFAKTQTEVPYGGLAYLYPPLPARLLYPLAVLPYFPAAFIWMSLKCAALEAAIVAILSLMRQPPTLLSLGLLHGVAVWFRPLAMDFDAGNVAVFEFALAAGAMTAWSKGKFTFAAIFLSACGMTKGFPLLLALYPIHLRERKWIRALLVVLAGIAGMMLFDFRALQSYVAFYRSPEWQKIWDEQVQSFYNCSSVSVILRTFSETYFSAPLYNSPLLVLLLIPLFPILVFSLVCYAVGRHQKKSGNPFNGNVLSLLFCGLLLIPPRLAGYTLAWTFSPAVQIIFSSLLRKQYSTLFLATLGVFLFQLNLPPQHVAQGITQLLIDKDFFGLFFLFIASFLAVVRKSDSNFKRE